MKIFLFYVNTLVGLDTWVDRKLIYAVDTLKEEQNQLYLDITTDEPKNFRKLVPGKSYALQFEEDDNKYLRYYSLKGFEIIPAQADRYSLVLHVDPIKT